jgi:hypothetical protein
MRIKECIGVAVLSIVGLLGIGSLLTACGLRDVVWNTANTSVVYKVQEVAPGEAPTTFDLALNFSGNSVNVVEKNKARAASIDSSGRLKLSNPNDAEVLYELPVLAVLPPNGERVRVGKTWTVMRPTDAEAATSDAIVGQEKFVYEVTEVTKDKVKVKMQGYLRIADSKGLDELLKNGSTLPPALAKPLIARWSPYLTGTAEFDVGSGSTSRAEGSRVPLGMFRSNGVPVAADQARVDYLVTRR